MNRLLVSSYVSLKEIEVKKNKRIKELLIQEKDKEEYQSVNEFTDLIKSIDRSFNYEELLELFEFVISPSDKVINGAVYTPCDIRKFITTQCFLSYSKDISKAKIVDISCGCGGFLVDAVNFLKLHTKKSYKNIFEENIFGIDIQKYSIERTEILLLLLALEHGDDEEVFKFNLYDGDSLEFEWKKENKAIYENNGFDIILGNPPYVCSRNMDDKTKNLMSKWDTCSTGHPDLYIPFFEIGYKLLNKNGILGYITVNSFIKSVNGRAIRKFFQDNNVDLKIIDFEDEQIFNSRMTYTSICFITNKISDCIYYKSLKSYQLTEEFEFEQHKYEDIDNANGWYINNRNLVKEIENIGIPFGEIYNTKSGIATLKNKVYIFTPLKKDDDEYFFIDEKTKIEKGICRKIVNSNLLVKTNKIDSFIERIIFPYRYDENNKIHVISEDILEKDYPYTYKYLKDNRNVLEARDKGKGKNYKYWYAFGRNQSLERTKYKLLFPQLAKEGFQSCLVDDENLYFYNGMAAMSNNDEELKLLGKIFMTDIFWMYVKSISKPYASNYFSLGRNYIKNFGIFQFNDREKEYIMSEKNIIKLKKYITKYYIKGE